MKVHNPSRVIRQVGPIECCPINLPNSTVRRGDLCGFYLPALYWRYFKYYIELESIPMSLFEDVCVSTTFKSSPRSRMLVDNAPVKCPGRSPLQGGGGCQPAWWGMLSISQPVLSWSCVWDACGGRAHLWRVRGLPPTSIRISVGSWPRSSRAWIPIRRSEACFEAREDLFEKFQTSSFNSS